MGTQGKVHSGGVGRINGSHRCSSKGSSRGEGGVCVKCGPGRPLPETPGWPARELGFAPRSLWPQSLCSSLLQGRWAGSGLELKAQLSLGVGSIRFPPRRATPRICFVERDATVSPTLPAHIHTTDHPQSDHTATGHSRLLSEVLGCALTACRCPSRFPGAGPGGSSRHRSGLCGQNRDAQKAPGNVSMPAFPLPSPSLSYPSCLLNNFLFFTQ